MPPAENVNIVVCKICDAWGHTAQEHDTAVQAHRGCGNDPDHQWDAHMDEVRAVADAEREPIIGDIYIGQAVETIRVLSTIVCSLCTGVIAITNEPMTPVLMRAPGRGDTYMIEVDIGSPLHICVGRPEEKPRPRSYPGPV
jgi:hypothetical protein